MPKQSAVDRLEALNLTAKREEIEAARSHARRIRFSAAELTLAHEWRDDGIPIAQIARWLDKSETALRTALAKEA